MIMDQVYGAEEREDLTVIGYWKNYLIAQNEKDSLFVTEHPEQLYDIGTVCPFDMFLYPAEDLPQEEYKELCRLFATEV